MKILCDGKAHVLGYRGYYLQQELESYYLHLSFVKLLNKGCARSLQQQAKDHYKPSYAYKTKTAPPSPSLFSILKSPITTYYLPITVY